MILPGVTLFPGALLPLHIFENRYRRMLELALVGERMFAIADEGEDGSIAPVGGLGVVRACVANPDGTSNLILQGTARVVFSRIKMRPFPAARIKLMADVPGDPDVIRELRRDVSDVWRQIRLGGVEVPQGFDAFLEQARDGGSFADALAAALITDPVERRGLLEEAEVAVRLERLLRFLIRRL